MERKTKIKFENFYGVRICYINGYIANYHPRTNAFYSYGERYPARDFYTHEYIYPNTSLFRKLFEKEVDIFIKSDKIYVRKLILEELDND